MGDARRREAPRRPRQRPHFSRLLYSGGNPNSDGRAGLTAAQPRIPGASPGSDSRYYLDRDGNGWLTDLERDADGDGLANLDEERRYAQGNTQGVRCLSASKEVGNGIAYFHGAFTQFFIDECAEKETKDTARYGDVLCAGINQVPFFCMDSAKPQGTAIEKVDSLDWLTADTDGDSVDDWLDDVDHDDISNGDEFLVELRAAPADRRYGPVDACFPNTDARFCIIASVDVDGDGRPNREDDDDDGDLLPDALETQIKTSLLRADSDGDGASDTFEYHSALDLNRNNLPYPAKRPYPNALFADSEIDYDGDVLTTLEEYKAWRYTGGVLPLTYSDGTQTTISGQRDDLRDVDDDGANNYLESHGPLSGPEWWNAWVGSRANKCFEEYAESPYPGPSLGGPAFRGLDFVDPDTDGDGVKDGADDIDHDGLTNVQEAVRPANWCDTYVSVGPVFFVPDDGVETNGGAHGGALPPSTGPNPTARMQPFNPCKPLNSSTCHIYAPNGYYKESDSYIEDWKGPNPS